MALDSEVVPRQIRILIAEDHPVNKQLMLQLLDTLGFKAEVAINGRKALESWKATHHDIILMDCQMPELDGYDVTREVRRCEQAEVAAGKSSGRTIIIAVTAHAMKGDRERCLHAGMDDYLTKPVDVEGLSEILKRWLPALRPEAASCPEARQFLGERSAEGLSDSSEDAAPLIDIKRIEKFTFGHPERVREILQLYLDESRAFLAAFESAMAQGAAGQVEYVVHRFAGMSANCGVTSVVPLLRKIEQLAGQSDFEQVRPFVADLQRRLAAVCEFVMQYSAQDTGAPTN